MSLSYIQNPTGEMPGQRVMDQLPFEQCLLERMLSHENLQSAWKRVRANKGAPGVDGITIDDFARRSLVSIALQHSPRSSGQGA